MTALIKHSLIILSTTSALYGNTIDIENFVSDLLGLHENVFNECPCYVDPFFVPGNSSQDPFFKEKNPHRIDFIQRRDTNTNDIIDPTTRELLPKYQAGYFEELSLADLKNATHNIKLGNGTFNVIESTIFPLETYFDKFDVGALQADPNNKDAVFQVASNFNALECVNNKGTGMRDITSYLYDKTQGPAASISAAPGTLFRQYYVFYDKNIDPLAWSQRLKNQVKITIHNKEEYLPEKQINFLDFTDIPVLNGYIVLDTHDKINQLTFNPEKLDDVGKIKIGFQGSTQVTYGLRKNTTIEKISQPQIINQVFTATIDFGNASGSKNIRNAITEKIAKCLLKVAYEGTIRTALFKNKKKVFLTLIGGGVFMNDIDWIIESIKNCEQLIKDSGLEVILIVFDSSHKNIAPKWSNCKEKLINVVKNTGGTYRQYAPAHQNGKNLYPLSSDEGAVATLAQAFQHIDINAKRI